MLFLFLADKARISHFCLGKNNQKSALIGSINMLALNFFKIKMYNYNQSTNTKVANFKANLL